MQKNFRYKTGEDTEVNVSVTTHHPLFKAIQTHFECNTQFFVNDIDDNTIIIKAKWADIELVVSILGYTSNDLKDCIAYCEESIKDYLTDVWFYDIKEVQSDEVQAIAKELEDYLNQS